MSGRARYVIITGLSGAGKSLTANCFEDMGYYCVDNLPIKLIPVFCDLISRSGGQFSRVAMVVDVREGTFLRDFPETVDQLRASNLDVFILFLDSADDVLIRRFSETRRPHPLSVDGSLEEGIRREREALKPIRDRANKVIDTSKFNVHELRAYLFDSFHETGRQDTLFVSMVSFGYKYGIPTDSDMIFDVRFLPNPHFQESLKGKSGLDAEVVEFMEKSGEYKEYYRQVASLLSFLMPRFVKEGKTYLTISIGCTGGRHRSVAMAQQLGEDMRRAGYRVRTVHRDMAKG
jgi:UPF0042 nucleotide-binding protein